MTATPSPAVQFNDLDKQDQNRIRRLMGSFLLTSGAKESLSDQNIQLALCTLSHVFKHHLTEVIGWSEFDLLKDHLPVSERISTGWQCALMIVIATTLLGQSTVRQMLSQALEDINDLEDMGILFLDCARDTLRKEPV